MFAILRIFFVNFKWWLLKIALVACGAYALTFFSGLWDWVWNKVKTQISSLDFGNYAVIVNFTDVAGWIASQCRFEECLQVILAGYLLKFTLRKIPFLRW